LDLGGLQDGNGIESDIGPCTCDDGIDNDGDGDVDLADAECTTFDPSADEGSGFGSCSDNLDNDLDGLTDSQDPLCRVGDAGRAETPIARGTCADGIDNDGDGSIDLADDNCLVGDPASSSDGNAIALQEVCTVGAGFYGLKNEHFEGDTARSLVFRYGILTTCDDSGGQAEIGGNDFVSANLDAGTTLHELGHTLGLRHGGDENHNCKPNYVSVMNYNLQFGIPRRTGGNIYDFSPPRYPGGRGMAPLGELSEDSLDENVVLDPGDRFNQTVYTDDPGETQRLSLDGDTDADRSPDGVDWDGDGSIASMPVRANIDRGSGACDNSDDDDDLSGHHDWSAINLSVRAQCGDPSTVWEFFEDLFGVCLNDDGAVNPVEGPEPTRDELVELQRQINASDLALRMTADSDLVEVGDDLTYTLEVENAGPNLATQVAAELLPSDLVTIESAPEACESDPEGLECAVGAVGAARSGRVEIVVGTAGACVDAVPQVLVGRSSAENQEDFAPTDPTPFNNRARLDVATQDTTRPEITCNAPEIIFPKDGADEDEPAASPISFTATAIDACDDSPTVEITGFDCFKLTRKSKRIDKTSSCQIEIDGDTLHVVDSGGIDDNIVWTVVSRDAAGNEASKECGVLVQRSAGPHLP
jgi:uncharacterized repeat protein (TIGR01451 family)